MQLQIYDNKICKENIARIHECVLIANYILRQIKEKFNWYCKNSESCEQKRLFCFVQRVIRGENIEHLENMRSKNYILLVSL